MVCGKESGFGEGVRLFPDPRIPYPDSRFIVRETGFSESWFGSALLSREVRGLRLRGISGEASPDSRFGVRETGFSESWFGSALLSKGAGDTGAISVVRPLLVCVVYT